jgi:hypothetical protein
MEVDQAYMNACAYCSAASCRKCLQTYILSRKEEPACFACKRAYNDDWLEAHTSKVFRTKMLRDHLKEVVWDRERALLPQSQSRAAARLVEKRQECWNQYEELALELDRKLDAEYYDAIRYRKRLLEYNKELQEYSANDPAYRVKRAKMTLLENYLQRLPSVSSRTSRPLKRFSALSAEGIHTHSIDVSKVNQEIAELMEQKQEYFTYVVGESALDTLRDQLGVMGGGVDRAAIANEETTRKEKHKNSITRACPKEDCRGFCNQQGRCELCNTSICTKCWVTLPSEQENVRAAHECKQEDVDSRSAIVADSKGCPSCNVLISRISGCDHMWCPNCKTGFNWRTGNKISNQENTNPMLREYQRRTGTDVDVRNPQDCTALPAHTWVAQQSHRLSTARPSYCLPEVFKYYDRLDGMFRVFVNKLTDFRRNIPSIDEINAELRVKYLLNELDETQFKIQSLAATRRIKAQVELIQLIEMLFVIAQSHLEPVVNAYDAYVALLPQASLNRWSPSTFEQTCKSRTAECTQKSNEFMEAHQRCVVKMEELRKYFNECLRQIAERHYAKTNVQLLKNNTIGEKFSMHGHNL